MIPDRDEAPKRARTEWPLFASDLIEHPLPHPDSFRNFQPSEDAQKAATRFLTQIAFASAGNPPFRFDELIVDVAKRRRKYDHKDLSEAMYSLYYRARIQSTFLNILHQLEIRGYFDGVEAFAEPIFAVKFEGSASTLAGHLSCFQFCWESDEKTVQEDLLKRCTGGFLDYALYWLAVVLIRGQASKVGDFWELFDVVEQTGFLGPLLRDRFEEYARHQPKLDLRQNPKLGSEGYNLFSEVAGWFLHRDLTRPKVEDKGNSSKLKQEYSIAIERFDMIEAAVKDYFGWDASTVLLAKDQLAQVQMEQDCETSGVI